ncbi:MAG: [FeFe] hydrogenase H-cluster maturation GTPase HydF [Clostridia bacterium]|nr:[FeFe] hydrogenase H-cluster maturation GTPase HydF [Clostridia bacterium]
MSLNGMPAGERVHIGFFGLRNAGKSSLVNAITGQKMSIVSDIKGTTTDAVQKTMEILPIGPVVIIDTPGFDDEGTLGELRIEKTKQALRKTDIAVLVVDAEVGITNADRELISLFGNTPYIIAYNKSDLISNREKISESSIYVSAKSGENVDDLKEKIAKLGTKKCKKRIVADIVNSGDTVILVIPIDQSAPKGRIILPQQMVIRDLLDSDCRVICCQPDELKGTFELLNISPRLVITDSQVFGTVSQIVPEKIMLTSFSILLARYRGVLPLMVAGAAKLKELKDTDIVLISEGCTHHRQCNDIGTVKLPGWIRAFSGANPKFEFSSGGEFPLNLNKYNLILHCGGCMLNETEMQNRILNAKNSNTPMVNYGTAIAYMHGILPRALSPFPDINKLLSTHF